MPLGRREPAPSDPGSPDARRSRQPPGAGLAAGGDRGSRGSTRESRGSTRGSRGHSRGFRGSTRGRRAGTPLRPEVRRVPGNGACRTALVPPGAPGGLRCGDASRARPPPAARGRHFPRTDGGGAALVAPAGGRCRGSVRKHGSLHLISEGYADLPPRGGGGGCC